MKTVHKLQSVELQYYVVDEGPEKTRDTNVD